MEETEKAGGWKKECQVEEGDGTKEHEVNSKR